MQRTVRAKSLAELAAALGQNNSAVAEAIAVKDFPWQLARNERDGVTKRRACQIFFRDRFIDRYSGAPLVFPGALIAIGRIMPQHFPIHPTWKAGHSHDIFWELWPVVDHVVPVCRGGANADGNYVTTSVINNSAKGNALLQELGWTLNPQPPTSETWDGLVGWFREITMSRPELLSDSQLKGWNAAIRNVAF